MICRLIVFAVIHDSTHCLLRLLLLAQLLVLSSSRPTSCIRFGQMSHHLDMLVNISKKLHELVSINAELIGHIQANRLHSLPHMHHTLKHFSSLKLNESLSELFSYSQSFKLHVEWLKTVKENFSLPSQAAEGASAQLRHLSDLLSTTLQQVRAEGPRPPPLPVASTTFEVLQYSVEISERLQVFANWSKRVLKSLQKKSHCGRH
uniref:Interleukin 11a n=1 Tax=Echeneis naucrates TaxID=173247 RepID=A0A665U455_ECHNA